MNMGHWDYPLTSADPAIVEKSIEIAKTSIRNAHFWGADTVLIVPGVVNEKTSYKDAYDRAQVSLRKLLPLAEQLKVTIAIEEVLDRLEVLNGMRGRIIISQTKISSYYH